MRDILWKITSFDTDNSLPFTTFENGIWPLLSIARARDRIGQLIRLINCGILALKDVPAFLDQLRAETGINMKDDKWSFRALIAAFKDHEKYVPTIFEYFPYDLGHKLFPILRPHMLPRNGMFEVYESVEVNLFYIAIKHVFDISIYNKAVFDRARDLLRKLETVLCKSGNPMFRRHNNEWNLSNSKKSFNYDNSWQIYDYMSRTNKPSKMDMLAYLRNEVPHHRLDLYNALLAYCRDEPIDNVMAETVLNDIMHVRIMPQIYLMGYHGFYEYLVAASSNPENWPFYLNRDLMRRAFTEPGAEFVADMLALVSKNLVRIVPNNVESQQWTSFLVSIGCKKAKIYNIGLQLDRDINYLYIFGQQSLSNYESAFNYTKDQLVGSHLLDISNYKEIYNIDTFNYGLIHEEDVLESEDARQAIISLRQVMGKCTSYDSSATFNDLCAAYEKYGEYEKVLDYYFTRPYIGDFILKYGK